MRLLPYQEKKFHPEEISSMILLKMKETAEAYLGSKINDAVARTLEVDRERPEFIVKPLPLHVVRTCSSDNFSAILLNLSQMVTSITVLGQRQ